MKPIRCLIAALLLVVSLSPVLARAADTATIHGILISASNTNRDTDRRLASYEPTLRRILRFESYHFLGDDHTTLTAAKKDELLLGDGNELAIETESVSEKGVHIRVRWTQAGRVLMRTALTLPPGAPAVLGGPVSDKKGEVYAIILIVQ